jgi:hypothetical protein
MRQSPTSAARAFDLPDHLPARPTCALGRVKGGFNEHRPPRYCNDPLLQGRAIVKLATKPCARRPKA